MARRMFDITNIDTTKDKLPEILYLFKRISGKHHIRTGKGITCINPGDIVKAPQGAYYGSQWECLGPEVPISEETIPEKAGSFTKEQRKDGWYAIHPETGKAINELPLTEEEVDILVKTTVEDT